MTRQLDYEKLRDMQFNAETKWDAVAAAQQRVISAVHEREVLRSELCGGYGYALSAKSIFMSEPFEVQEKATPKQLADMDIDPGRFASYLAACRRVDRLQHHANALRERHGPYVRLVSRLEQFAGVDR